jgi:dipeptidyl aminopeptidase/acylaminoacyl peptidase
LLALQPDASVLAVPFDRKLTRTRGAGIAVLKDVAIGANGAPALAVSENGSLVYATGYLRASGRELLTLSQLNLAGQVQPLPFEPDTFNRPKPSPDGRRIAVTTWDGSIWVFDVQRGTRERLPGPTSDAQYLVWSPDGARVSFSAYVEGVTGMSLLWQKSDGSEPPEVLIGGGPEKTAVAFTPDGRDLIYREVGSPTALWKFDLREKGARKLLEGSIRSAELSRDGRWLIYDSAESGKFEVYARRFPALDRKIQVSAGGGGVPHWSPDGRAIYYFVGDQIVRVRVTAGENLEVSRPETLFEVKGMRSFAVAPDGNGFYATMRAPDSGMVRQLHLVTNWFSELERLAPAGETP